MQRRLPAAQGGEAIPEFIQAHRQIGKEGVGADFGELPMDRDSLLRGLQRRLPTTQGGEVCAEIAQARRQSGGS